MNIQSNNEPPNQSTERGNTIVRVNGRVVELNDATPTGRQILAAAGMRPVADYALLRWPENGPTNEVALEDIIKLPIHGQELEFFAIQADGVSYFTLDEERFAWAGPLDVETIRQIGRVDEAKQLWLERTNKEDLELLAGDTVDLDAKGVERIYTRQPVWHLKVQNQDTEWSRPTVSVREALIKAGYDVSKPWEIKFKVKDQPIRPVGLDEILDLSQPGVERLRVAPANVDNGDGAQEVRRDFSLLAADAAFLDGEGFRWRTVVDGARWLIVDDYALPVGYNVLNCTLAIEMPSGYPDTQLDMFYCAPDLLANGQMPPQTQARQVIDGQQFQRWSRHRGVGCAWTPGVDNLASHFALIELSLSREVGQ